MAFRDDHPDDRIALSPKEREAIRRHLIAYMRSHPSSVAASGRLLDRVAILRRLGAFPLRSLAVLLGVLSAIGGTAFAAERSLPGEVLYPMKVMVNEPLRSALLFSPSAKDGWEMQLLERRLEEAETLAARGALTADARTVVAARFTAHADRVAERIAALEAEGDFPAAAELSSTFEGSLRAHERVLEHLHEEGTADVLEIVRAHGDVASSLRMASEGKVIGRGPDAAPLAHRQRAQAQRAVEGAREALAALRAEIGQEASADAEARLEIAEGLIAEGQAKLAAGSAGDAFTLFERAKRIAKEAKVIAAARKDLRVDVPFDGRAEDALDDHREGREDAPGAQRRGGDDGRDSAVSEVPTTREDGETSSSREERIDLRSPLP